MGDAEVGRWLDGKDALVAHPLLQLLEEVLELKAPNAAGTLGPIDARGAEPITSFNAIVLG